MFVMFVFPQVVSPFLYRCTLFNVALLITKLVSELILTYFLRSTEPYGSSCSLQEPSQICYKHAIRQFDGDAVRHPIAYACNCSFGRPTITP